MIYTHYSPKPIKRLRAIKQKPSINKMKPLGLWYSVNGDWERWCKAEKFGSIDKKLRYEVTFGDENILRLRTARAVIEFNQQYTVTDTVGHVDFIWPDWPRLAREYDGIEIAPYQWSLRHRFMWYYGWDCASGCVWKPRGMRVSKTMRRRLRK